MEAIKSSQNELISDEDDNQMDNVSEVEDGEQVEYKGAYMFTLDQLLFGFTVKFKKEIISFKILVSFSDTEMFFLHKMCYHKNLFCNMFIGKAMSSFAQCIKDQ